MSELPIRVVKSMFILSCFDRKDKWLFHHYHVTVEERGEDSWAVVDPMGDVLSDKGEWECELLPSSRPENWLAHHRFDYATAMAWARKVLPYLEVNGVTASEAWAKAKK